MTLSEVEYYNLSRGSRDNNWHKAVTELRFIHAFHLWNDHKIPQWKACRQSGVKLKEFRKWLDTYPT